MTYKSAAALEMAIKGLPDPERPCSAARAGSEKTGLAPPKTSNLGRARLPGAICSVLP